MCLNNYSSLLGVISPNCSELLLLIALNMNYEAEKAVDAHALTKRDKHDRLLNPEVMVPVKVPESELEKRRGVGVGQEI